MKKNMTMVLLVIICIFTGCSKSNNLDLLSEDVESIIISTLPIDDSYARSYTSEEKIQSVIEYINSLDMEDKFDENPDEYVGQTYIIEINHVDEKQETYYHFGNMFWGDEKGNWKRMKYKEASLFDNIVRENLSD